MNLPVDIVIKILVYLRKLISRVKFLKLRFLRKKIAAAFRPNYFFFKSENNIFQLPDHINTFKIYDTEQYREIIRTSEFLNKNKHISKIHVVNDLNNSPLRNLDFYYCNCDHINIYKGPYYKNLHEFKSLEVITIYELEKCLPYFPLPNLKKLILYLHNNCDLYFNSDFYPNLKNLKISGREKSTIGNLAVSDKLETLIITGIKTYTLSKRKGNATKIIINK